MIYFKETYTMGQSLWKCDEGRWYTIQINYIRSDGAVIHINGKWELHIMTPSGDDIFTNERYKQITEK